PPYRIHKIAARPARNTEIDRVDVGPRVSLDQPIVGRHIAIADGSEETEADRVAERGIKNGWGGLNSRGRYLGGEQDAANRQTEAFKREEFPCIHLYFVHSFGRKH